MSPVGGVPPQPSRILVVDDAELNRDLLSRRLRRDGHSVGVAVNGREALETLAREPFDVVLLDINMPEMDGYETLERLKADPALQHIPVIMITAVSEDESIARCLTLGAEDHLPKPFNPMILRARVNASLARKQLHDREQLYAQSMARELEIGRRIQAGFFPEELPRAAGWELAAYFSSAREVAGDFYDAFTLPGNLVALVVGDVCDKGVGAALFMALFRSLFRAISEQRFSGTCDPSDALHSTLTATNDYIARTHGSANMFATVFFAVLDTHAGSLRYINAGHEAPTVVSPAGSVRERLTRTGPAVGIFPAVPFEVARTSLQPGETLFAFTDGVIDMRNAAGDEFSESRLLELLSTPAPAADALLSRVRSALATHADGEPAFDDVTMLALRCEAAA